MNDDRYRRIKQLTQRALELDAAERAAFLARECGDDHDLLHEVMRLLEYDDSRAEDATVFNVPSPQDLTGQTLGPYEILERLGEGGMGVVYLAAQSAPLRRKVAIKVIKLGMDTHEVITRFKSERQALALMDHPNIARVHDAGATGTGRPYFVMEYIHGVSLTRYCREHGLGLRRRLELFIQVCEGVYHAHQKGVIHRDLKPGNILDRGRGRAGAQDHRFRRGQGHRAAPRRADLLHAARPGGRHTRVHEPRAGRSRTAGHRHAQRRLLAGRDPLRVDHGRAAEIGRAHV
jgi:serine/threonine protein kinase